MADLITIQAGSPTTLRVRWRERNGSGALVDKNLTGYDTFSIVVWQPGSAATTIAASVSGDATAGIIEANTQFTFPTGGYWKLQGRATPSGGSEERTTTITFEVFGDNPD